MQTASAVDPHWPALLQRLSGVLDLDASAQATGALRRRRAVTDGATLLRLALAHGPGGLSLRSAAAWAGLSGVASLSDVALRKRLRGAADWLALIAGALLRGMPAALTAAPLVGRHLRIVDASGIKSPGAKGTPWRLHADYDSGAARFTSLELTDLHVAEGFTRLHFGAGEVALGDRGYARPKSLQHVLASGADFIVRVGWYSLRMTTPEGKPLDWAPIYAGLAPGEVTERQVFVTRHSKGPGRRSRPLFPARLIVMRQHAEVGRRALRAVRERHRKQRWRGTIQPLTLASTGYLMVLTSLPADAADAAEVLAAYRLRWQVALAFKRLKSGLGIDRSVARDRQMGRSWLFAHLILALLIEDAASEVLDAPPVRQVGPKHPVSLWRLHLLVRSTLLGAVLRTTATNSLAHAAALLLRHICGPPRRRPSQAAATRAATPGDGMQKALP